MLQIRKFTIPFHILFYSTTSLAEQLSFIALPSANEQGITSMNCASTGRNSNRLQCKLSHVFVSKRRPEDIKKDLQDSLEKINSTELNKVFEETKKGCISQKKNPENLERKKYINSLPLSEVRKRDVAREDEEGSRLCTCFEKSELNEARKCLIALETENATAEAKTCTVVVNPYSLELKKVSENKWISAPGPKGLCNVAGLPPKTVKFD